MAIVMLHDTKRMLVDPIEDDEGGPLPEQAPGVVAGGHA
jgi:hypothetical protein